MIEQIFEEDKTLLFVNLIEDDKHKKKFGIDKVSKQIRNAINYIKESNIKILMKKKK